jgi:asparaginyl-tRNA synthetase
MLTPLVREVLAMEATGQGAVVQGWVRTKREAKNLVFIELNDGSCMKGLQVVAELESGGLDQASKDAIGKAQTGASLRVEGSLVPSPAEGQAAELRAARIELLGEADPETYPLQKKRHSMEFLRDISHLRARTNTFGAVARVRSEMSFAIHSFFRDRGFSYVHTPLITASDCEGAGAMFQVTTLDLDRLGKSGKAPDYAADFFGKRAYLTVSGQLEGETYATALSRVYTFGPTFRAENSNTTRHLAEFWMIEPEMAFARLEENMELAEAFVRHLLTWALDKCGDDIDFFNDRIQSGLRETLEKVASSSFARVTYTEAVSLLEKSGQSFEYPVGWGQDLQSEHEKYLTEKVFGKPVIVTDYPKEIKAFYMRGNEDGKTVRAMDVLVPRLGEIIGGSEREERLDVLEARLKELGLEAKDYWWYLDLRRFGSVPHSGFGLGFERLMLYVTGMANIRDVIPYPRAAGLADF